MVIKVTEEQESELITVDVDGQFDDDGSYDLLITLSPGVVQEIKRKKEKWTAVNMDNSLAMTCLVALSQHLLMTRQGWPNFFEMAASLHESIASAIKTAEHAINEQIKMKVN